MTAQLHGLSSMATKALLITLTDLLHRDRSISMCWDSAGGVAVARDVRDGAEADLVVLDADAMGGLCDEGFVWPDTLTPLFESDVVAATPDDAPPIRLESEDELRVALINAGRIAYSTGPSGRAFTDLLERWDLSEPLSRKLIQTEPGTPVGAMLIAGDADLGFQQRSEFSGFERVRVLGPLPGATAIRSTFSGAVLTRSTHADLAREALIHLGSDQVEAAVRTAGMTPARNRARSPAGH